MRIVLAALAVASAALVISSPSPASASRATHASRVLCGNETHKTKGLVKGFAKDRAYVLIAHEKIDGYMEAMTMSFRPRAAEQIARLREGDKVAFTFTTGDDGVRWIDTIAKVEG